ncbi:hypothetical protein SAMN04487928_1446 [Butyrivibrio proteoclasticus]|uniref:Uncharacterized protein n=1 Tax=Butyrivibrio proteoclasticus TaxID=43305 RepID=A0A1I5YE08_9FIRM|nr:hypothetical protein [Butyrivibrio proteoclasticus]SFQ42107.1 hypothetical protein SAMN04487928_1446 [Butyrivibrio proteoclasticus]
MVLQDEFEKAGYKDILNGSISLDYEICLDDLYDKNMRPEELLGIYISRQRDDLFFLLKGDVEDINLLCDSWDERIRVFSIINENTKAVKKLKYNIVQLIVVSSDEVDKSIEGNLMFSRKLIIKGDLSDKSHIKIAADEAIELPFHMIKDDGFTLDENKVRQLSELLPSDEELLLFMKKNWKKVIRKKRNDVYDKSLKLSDFEKVKEWLEQ